MSRFSQKIITTLALVLFFTGTAQATIISYEATNLADTTVGEDLWQYSYTVSDYSFNEFFGFQVFFDYGDFDNITPVSASAEWDAISWNPDLIMGIPDDGVYDAMALVDNASLATPFTVNFTWLGSGIPETQYFEIYDDNFAVIESGQTEQKASSPVPEPATILLFGAGLLGMITKKSCLEI